MNKHLCFYFKRVFFFLYHQIGIFLEITVEKNCIKKNMYIDLSRRYFIIKCVINLKKIRMPHFLANPTKNTFG